jgi:hypothetical protein
LNLGQAVIFVDRFDQSHTLAADDAARRFGTEEPAEHTSTTPNHGEEFAVAVPTILVLMAY